jgi:hypothetical protein
MRRTDLSALVTFLSTLAFALVALKLLAPRLLGRDMTLAELAVIGLTLCAAAVWSRMRSSRRQRQRLDQIRDSALW